MDIKATCQALYIRQYLMQIKDKNIEYPQVYNSFEKSKTKLFLLMEVTKK